MSDPESQSPKLPANGITINERLFSAGVYREWDKATAARNRERMIALLMRVGFSVDEAERAAADVLAKLPIR